MKRSTEFRGYQLEASEREIKIVKDGGSLIVYAPEKDALTGFLNIAWGMRSLVSKPPSITSGDFTIDLKTEVLTREGQPTPGLQLEGSMEDLIKVIYTGVDMSTTINKITSGNKGDRYIPGLEGPAIIN